MPRIHDAPTARTDLHPWYSAVTWLPHRPWLLLLIAFVVVCGLCRLPNKPTTVEVAIENPSGQPVAGAEVSLYCIAFLPLRSSCSEMSPARLTTDRSGVCRFKLDMHSGAYLHIYAAKGTDEAGSGANVEPGVESRTVLTLQPRSPDPRVDREVGASAKIASGAPLAGVIEVARQRLGARLLRTPGPHCRRGTEDWDISVNGFPEHQ